MRSAEKAFRHEPIQLFAPKHVWLRSLVSSRVVATTITPVVSDISAISRALPHVVGVGMADTVDMNALPFPYFLYTR